MFLEMLNKQEKESFLDLAIKAAEINGVVAREEIQMLHTFATEMRIPAREKTERELDSILDDFVNNSSKRSMKITVFELIGILFSDSEFDDSEKKFLNLIISKFGLSPSLKDEMISEINAYSDLYNRICKTVIL